MRKTPEKKFLTLIYEKPKVFANNYTISDLELKIANSEFKYENEKYVANILVDMDYSVAKKILPFIKEQKKKNDFCLV